MKLVQPTDKAVEKYHRAGINNKRKMLMKQLTHDVIDQIWNTRNYCKRNEVYKHIRTFTGWPLYKSHIGGMGIEECKIIISWGISILNAGRLIDIEFGLTDVEIVTEPSYDFLEKIQ